jgi:radical SAM protein with 4Fe4S-binding SPASM domain
LFAAPLNTPGASFGLSPGEAEAALQRLFVHWLGRRRRIPTLPLHDYLGIVLRRRRGETTWRYDRSLGEWALIVNTDGTLYQTHEAYREAWALGNVFHQTIDEVIGSDRYADSLDRDRRVRTRTCRGCGWEPSCSLLPAFDGLLAGERETRCHYGYALCQFIDEYFTRHRFSIDRIARLAE